MLQELLDDLLNVAVADFTISCRLAVVTVELLGLGSLDQGHFLEEKKNQSCNELSRSIRTLAHKHSAKSLSGNIPHIVVCVSQLSYEHLPESKNALLLTSRIFEEKRMDYCTIKQRF